MFFNDFTQRDPDTKFRPEELEMRVEMEQEYYEDDHDHDSSLAQEL